MPVAAVMAAGVVAGALQARDARQQAKQQNRYMQMAAQQANELMQPGQIRGREALMDPMLWQAMNGQKGSSPWQQALWQIYNNPGYIDPRLKVAPETSLAQGAQVGTQQGLSAIARSGGEGGMANVLPSAMQAAMQMGRANVGAQFLQLSEQQRRQDIDWGQQAQERLRSGAEQVQSNMADRVYNSWANQQPVMGWGGIMGGAIQGGLAAYSGLQGAKGVGYQGAGTQLGDVNKYGGWFNAPVGTSGFGNGAYGAMSNAIGSSFKNSMGGAQSLLGPGASSNSPQWAQGLFKPRG